MSWGSIFTIVLEAPTDGYVYARQNGAWLQVPQWDVDATYLLVSYAPGDYRTISAAPAVAAANAYTDSGLAAKANLSGASFTGDVTAPTFWFDANGGSVSYSATMASGRLVFTPHSLSGPAPDAMSMGGAGDVDIPALTTATQSPGDNSTNAATTAYVDAAVAGIPAGPPGPPGAYAGPIPLPLFSGSTSTKFGSSTKLVVGGRDFDPTDPKWGLTASSTATLYMLLETTNGASAACGELFQKSGTGAPQIIAATSTTTSTTATLVSANVSAAFKNTSPAGTFVARVWTATPNGATQATCTGAWLEITP